MNAVPETISKLLRVYCALLALLTLTASAYRYTAGWYSTPVAIGAAAAKLALILWFFMNLRGKRSLVRIFAAAGFFWLGILVVLSESDYLTRSWPF